jgi:protein-disulfide isomerase
MRTIIPINRPPYPLHVIEYGDFNSPRCRELQQLLMTTLPQFGDHIYHTFRHFPESGNPSALLMALAAEAARRQEQYQAMHRALFAHAALRPVSLDSVSALASAVGLDLAAFLNDMNDITLKQRIRADVEQGQMEGVLATPALFLGSRRLHGKLTQSRLAPLIHYYIERSHAPVLGTVDSDNGLVRWSSVGYH